MYMNIYCKIHTVFIFFLQRKYKSLNPLVDPILEIYQARKEAITSKEEISLEENEPQLLNSSEPKIETDDYTALYVYKVKKDNVKKRTADFMSFDGIDKEIVTKKNNTGPIIESGGSFSNVSSGFVLGAEYDDVNVKQFVGKKS